MNPHTANPPYGEAGGVLRLDNPVHYGERNKDWQRRMSIANYFRQFVHPEDRVRACSRTSSWR